MEEIPARMQERAADQLKESFEQKLSVENISFDTLTTLSHQGVWVLLWKDCQTTG